MLVRRWMPRWRCLGMWWGRIECGRAGSGGAAMHLAADAAPLCTLWMGDRCAELLVRRVWGGAGLVIVGQTFVFGGQGTQAARTILGRVLSWRGYLLRSVKISFRSVRRPVMCPTIKPSPYYRHTS
jgi:hypothetical protein